MLSSLITILPLLAISAWSLPTELSTEARAVNCGSKRRIGAGQGVIDAYASNPIPTTFAKFDAIGFSSDCATIIYANGAPGVQVAYGNSNIGGVDDFGVNTRQVFSLVTGTFTDFPTNNSMVIHADITLGVSSIIPIPVTFHGEVFLDLNDACEVSAVRAFATIPTEVLGIVLHPPGIPGYI